jgi:hypothetical protein
MSAGGAGAGFTVSTGEAALSRLLSSIIIVVCSGAAMLCYRAPAHRSLLWMMLSDDGDAFQISSIAPLPRQRGKGEARRQDFWFCFFGAEQAVRHSGSSRTFSSCCHPRGVAQGRSLDERMHASAGGVHRTE